MNFRRQHIGQMKYMAVRSALRVGLLALAFAGAGIATVQADDPAEWRDQRRADLRTAWDKLEGQPAPALAVLEGWLQAESGKTWEALRGKVVLIDYWATWCGPCKAALPHLQALTAKYDNDELVVLGVHSRRNWETMPDFVKSEKLSWTFADDRTGALGKALGVKYIPCYFAIDKRGIMRVAGVAPNKLEAVVKALLKEPYTPPTEKRAQQMEAENVESVVDPNAAGWPPILKKTLYASDWRGKLAPTLFVEEWLTKKPALEGKVLLVDFWATWCRPCRKLIPELNEIQARFKDDLVVLGLSDEDAETVNEFRAETEMAYTQAVDPKGRTKRALGVLGIPHVLIVSTDGVVRWQGVPLSVKDKLTQAVIEQIIERDPGVAKRRAAEALQKKSKMVEKTTKDAGTESEAGQDGG